MIILVNIQLIHLLIWTPAMTNKEGGEEEKETEEDKLHN